MGPVVTGPRRPRLVDVARTAGVSTATVSRALTGRPGVGPELARRIRQVAEDLGYVVNEQARSLASGRSNTVGLLVHEIGDPYFSEIASGVMDEAARAGVSVHLANTGRDPASEVEQAKLLISGGVRAVVVAGSGLDGQDYHPGLGAALERFQGLGGIVSLIGRHHFPAASVRPDNVAAGRTLGEHLVGLGHSRIGLVRGNRDLTAITDRVAGLGESLGQAGIAIAALPTRCAPFHREGGHEATLALLRDHPEVTAVVALNDAMAVGAIAALRELGLRVPQDVSVVGFNDIAVAQDLSPALTTVRLGLGELGRVALRNALAPVEDPPLEVWLGHELMVRASTAPPRA